VGEHGNLTDRCRAEESRNEPQDQETTCGWYQNSSHEEETSEEEIHQINWGSAKVFAERHEEHRSDC